MSLRVVFVYAAAAFSVWWVIQHPEGAAHVVQNIGHLVRTTASAAVARTLRFP